ncbi:hypothetical protein BOTBODRAFT_43025 [Botryobasidium botryosum FD-172 SS1]|uniref:Uncharacterized protein n=1 Tax=Botryobasidium botryosum (strain FD-172 SS1) TaxID=930990 RepID=A0A067MRS5_BOTB1|nr:hypothetical protein BOTBODRAFT_43025 [Botryobasidium botryosum FD-172 SS1]
MSGNCGSERQDRESENGIAKGAVRAGAARTGEREWQERGPREWELQGREPRERMGAAKVVATRAEAARIVTAWRELRDRRPREETRAMKTGAKERAARAENRENRPTRAESVR